MIKHSVILPDGKTATRNSRTRTYPYAVASLPDFQHALADASQISDVDLANYAFTAREAEIQRYNTSLPASEYRMRMHAENLHATSAHAYAHLRRDARVKRVHDLNDKGVYDRWTVEGWCGSRRLADKLATRVSNQPRNAQVLVLRTNQHP